MGTHERKERERHQRREQILNAAMDIMAEQEFESTTMDEIAERAELSKGTLYLYYKDKSALHQAIKRKALLYLREQFLSVLQKDISGKAIVRSMSHTFLDVVCDNPTFTKAMLLHDQAQCESLKNSFESGGSTTNDESEPDTQYSIYEQCLRLEQELRMLIVRAIQIGIQDNSIQSTLDPKFLSIQIGLQLRGVLQMVISGKCDRTMKFLDQQNISIYTLIDEFLNIQLQSA